MVEPQSDTLSVAPNLHSLPKEVINHVCNHLSRTEIIELSRVARPLLYLAEEHIWEELSLFLPDHYGEYPLEQPYAPSDGAPYDKWCLEEATELAKRRQKGLKKKLQTIMNRAGEEEWSRVKDITMELRPGSLPAMLLVLDNSSSTLAGLTINGTQDQEALPLIETLDVRIINCGITLSALTCLVLSYGSFWLSGTILALIKLSPQLRYLDVTHGRYPPDDQADVSEVVPDIDLDCDTRIREIWFRFPDCDDGEDVLAGKTLVTIVQHSPELRQVSLSHVGISEEAIATILPALGAHGGLIALDFPVEADLFCDNLDVNDPGFSTLRTLVLRPGSWAYLSTRLPSLSHVECLYLDVSQLSELSSTAGTFLQGGTRALAVEPAFRDVIRNAPSLQAIHELHGSNNWRNAPLCWRLDEIEKDDQLAGFVYSLKHGDEELVHLRRLTTWVELADCPWSMADTVLASPAIPILYTTPAGVERAKLVMVRSEDAWQDYTDYQGAIVPLDIIQAMREAEGTSKEAWKKRGVQVGDEAWKVLTDWHAGYLAGQAAEQA